MDYCHCDRGMLKFNVATIIIIVVLYNCIAIRILVQYV